MSKKIVLCMFVALLAVLCCVNVVAYADETDFKQTEEYNLVKEICQYNREGGVNSQLPLKDGVQEYLINKFHKYAPNAVVNYKTFSDGSNYFNIEAKLNKVGRDKQIIIGAHYDSTGEGATDNACGVAAALLIAKKLAQNVDQLPYNVVFVLFDGEEKGMLGAYDYVGKMTASDRDNTLVMFNIDSIANGDNLYLWCENKHTDLADLIIANSRGLLEKPYAKGAFNLHDPYGYGYYELIQGSDHTPFRVEGIPTALFFSGTYSGATWNYSENSNAANRVMNTSLDTFEYLENNVGAKFVERIRAVVDGISNSVLQQDFIEVAANARTQLVNLKLWYNRLWPTLVVITIIIALVAVIVLHYRKLQKKAILGTAEIKTTRVFTTPDAEDIFTFKK